LVCKPGDHFHRLRLRTHTERQQRWLRSWLGQHALHAGWRRARRALLRQASAVASDGPDDVGQGRLLPTTSIEQYAATLGKWMGASDSDLLSLLPNLANYNAGTRNLGFV
jgi:uncharacterized protein (DUF1501 family)